MPIFDQKQAMIARGEAELRMALAHEKALAIDVRSEVRAARERVKATRMVVDRYATVMLPLQERAVKLSQQEYDAMLLGAYQLLPSQAERSERVPRLQSKRRGTTGSRVRSWIARWGVATCSSKERWLHDLASQHSFRCFDPGERTWSFATACRECCRSRGNRPSAIDDVYSRRHAERVHLAVDHERRREGVFTSSAEPVKREFAPGMVVDCWGYNGSTPGPTIEAVEGDRVRLFVTNKLPERTSMHWHGVILPNGMDGVAGLTQPHIAPGETYVYEFVPKATRDAHVPPAFRRDDADGARHDGLLRGASAGRTDAPIDRDFAIFLAEWAIAPGTSRPNPMVMLDFNTFTFNSPRLARDRCASGEAWRSGARAARESQAWTATRSTCTATACR